MLPAPPDTGLAMEQTPPRLQRKLNKQSAFDTMSFKHVGNNDVHSLH